MALKKPSDFFGKNKKTHLDEVKESYDSACPEKIEQVSEAFGTFKENLNHIQSLSDFTSTFDSFKENLEKVETVSSEISSIKDEIKTLIKKEDLDSAMMAQLLFVDESITKIESRVSSINGKTVEKIKEDFVNLSNSVESFLSIDAPKYKRLISESEVRVDGRFDNFKTNVEENLNTIRVDVGNEVTSALESIESVNENTINIVKAEFKETVRDVNKNVSELVEKELPKYNKLFAETEVRTEEKINEVIDSYKQDIENLNAKVKLFTETEIPKYSNLLIETKLKSEKEVKDLEEEVLSKVNILSEKVQLISEGIPEKTSEKIQELKDITDEYKEEIDSISKKYQSLYKDFKKREVSENEKLENYSQDIERYHKRFDFLAETVTEDIVEIQNVLVASNKSYHASLETEAVKFRDKISEQMKGLEVDLVTNEKHIKKQNDNIESIQEEIKEVLERLQLDKLEEKNKELVEKINYLEETISEINEKKLLKEDNPTLPGNPSTNNSSDGLTPLDQKFATLDDLQNHYRLFINRIQQQIATIGGGGAGFIKDLDDVTFDQTAGENKLLIYNGSKWVGIASTALGGGSVGAGGTWASNSIGISTTKNVGIGTTTAKSGVALFVAGDIEATNVNVAGTITYDDVTNVDSVGLITARSGILVGSGVTIEPNGQANFIGIVTASQFSGFNHLIAPFGTTTTINVEVAAKTSAHRYFNSGSSQGYVLDGVESPFLTLTPGRTYRFSGSIGGSHPFRFYLDAAKSTAYTTGVTVETNYVELEVTDSTPTVLHYQCSNHGFMGNSVQVNSSNSIQLNSQDASYYLDYDNFTNTPTPITNNNQLTNGAGFITTSFTNTSELTNDAGFITNNVTGDFTLTDTDTGSAAGPELTLYRNSASPSPGDYLGQIIFKGENSNGGEENYAKITGKIADETLGTEDGIIETAIKGDGSFTIVSRQRSDELQLLNGVGLSVDGDSTFTGSIDVDGHTELDNFRSVGVATISTGVGTVHIGVGNTTLLVQGDARVTGILTIGTGSITLDPNEKKISGIDEIIIGTATTVRIHQGSSGEVVFSDREGKEASVGIGTTVSINTIGIVTASSFVGNLTGTASQSTIVGGVTTSYLLDYNNFTNTPTLITNNNQLSNGSGYITTSVTNTNQLTNGAGFITTSVTNTNQLTNGAGFITTSVTNTNQLTNGAGFITNSVTGDLVISGSVSVGGTLSYTDVTDIDSVGLITAQQGIDVTGGTIKVGAGFTVGQAGIVTANQFVSSSTTLPFYPPVVTTTQRDAMTVSQGAMIFNSTSKKMEFYDGTSWQSLPGMSLGLTVALDG